MKYYIPTKVYQEIDAVKTHAEELTGYGNCALIVTGKYSARANGALADVEAALDTYGKKHVQYDEIEENPSVETVMKATEFGKRNCDWRRFADGCGKGDCDYACQPREGCRLSV